MSLFSTLNVGASGLGVSSTWMSVIGDNISNMNTVGYKAGRASFADFMPQNVFGVGGGGQIGAGAVTNQVATMLGQGSLETTSSSLDMAIAGNGFFMVNDGQQSYYTRAGEFGVDDQGYVVNAAGLRVQGYSGDNGQIAAGFGDLQIPTDGLAAEATGNVVVDANLSADTEIGTELAALDFYGTGTGTSSLTDAGEAADFTSSVTIYDSRGVGHDVTLLFERSGESDWTYRAVVDASEVTDSTGTAFASESGSAFEIASGTVTFDADGNMAGFTQTNTADTTTWTFEGSSTPEIAFDFGMDASGVETDGGMTMSGGESTVTAISQDGNMAGQLTGVSVSEDGTIVGEYDNGESVDIGQVAVVTFQAPQELVRAGNSLFSATPGAGEAAIGVAGAGGRGTIAGNALEKSNVNLEEQFVQMITAQRSYQASSRVVSTANDTLQQLLQLI